MLFLLQDCSKIPRIYKFGKINLKNSSEKTLIITALFCSMFIFEICPKSYTKKLKLLLHPLWPNQKDYRPSETSKYMFQVKLISLSSPKHHCRCQIEISIILQMSDWLQPVHNSNRKRPGLEGRWTRNGNGRERN